MHWRLATKSTHINKSKPNKMCKWFSGFVCVPENMKWWMPCSLSINDRALIFKAKKIYECFLINNWVWSS